MVLRPPLPPGHPVLLARFGLPGLLPAQLLAGVSFREREARALLAGAAAHSLLRLSEAGTGAVALLMLASAHAGGWPLARGGSASVARVMVRRLEELGGEVRCNHQVASVDDLPPHRAVLLDLVPKEVLEVARRRFTPRYRDKLAAFRHGPGVFKLDWTLDAPIPWRSADCARAATVHLGGTMEEIAQSEREVAQGRHPARPFVLLTQPTLFDPSRAPEGKHVAWAYCHVPNGSTYDMLPRLEAQIERFAPGFRDCVLSRRVFSPAALQSMDANLLAGDINGGAPNLLQFVFRPTPRLYATSAPDIYLCSSSTPPGGGVHGMCGFHAAKFALKAQEQ